MNHNIKSNKEKENLYINKVEVPQLEQKLSFAQERLWFIDKFEEGTAVYNIPMFFELTEEINVMILESSLKKVIQRHAILRTLIKEDKDGNGYQEVVNLDKIPVDIKRIKVLDKTKLEEAFAEELSYVYKLDSECPIRISLYEEKSECKCYLGIVVHHIAFDGRSAGIFLRDLQSYYQDIALPELSIQYKDFALWQRVYLNGERLEKQLSYWKNNFYNYVPLNLVTDKTRPSKIDYSGADINFKLNKEVSNGLRALAKSCRVSLYSILLSGYCLMLKVYSNQNDIVLGSPAANRHYDQIEELIGFFDNILALRVRVDSNLSIKEFIERVAQIVIEAQLHQDLPFEKLVEALQIEKDINHHPLFQVMFGVQSFGNQEDNKNKFLIPYKVVYRVKVAKFDLSTFIDDSKEILQGWFNYAISLYHKETIERFVDTYKEILKQFSVLAIDTLNTEKRISELQYINGEDYNKIVYKWNETDKKCPNDKTLQELFEEQVQRTPDNVAVLYEDIQLTYQELNHQANQLAHYLRNSYQIQGDDLIALCLDRSEQMLVVMLAVLKAGAAYVPIDPAYPDERIKYMLDDTKTKIILTNKIYSERLTRIALNFNGLQADVLIIDENEFKKIRNNCLKTNLKIITNSKNLAYVIYTSGTTGKPKGVMIEHKAIITRLTYFAITSNIKKDFNILAKTSYSFDASCRELYLALLSGAKLILLNDVARQTPSQLLESIKYYKINLVLFVPSQLRLFTKFLYEENISNSALKSLEFIYLSGEPFKIEDIKMIINDLPELTIRNQFGATEGCMIQFEHSIKNMALLDKTSIGKPIHNIKAYVLGDNLTLLPIGAIGELYIGGVGLARGYLNLPELTAERFIANPFQTELEKEQHKNEHLYKTGDLVRYLPGGNLEYIGRNDFQVKIRGYRVELGEIESVLSQYNGIKQSVVIAREYIDTENKPNGNYYLVGYYIANDILDESILLTYLGTKLPKYMVPNVLVPLTEFKLTTNGKLDRNSLPLPELINGKNYVAPRSDIENKIVEIWAKVLELPIDKIGIHDDFFRLGGNSILATQLIGYLNKYNKCNLNVTDIFLYKTIHQLSKRVFMAKNNYQVIIKLNTTKNARNLFMIHPGAGGCEVYIDLASKLSDKFSCYGVDSYNLYNENKILELRKLAKYYLENIDKIMINTNQDEYHILGWSFGGHIALEIASILENSGIVKIKLYLLDTMISDDYSLSLINNVDVDQLVAEYEANAILKGYDFSYIQKVVSNLRVESKLVVQKISSHLKHTEILFFKAMLDDTRYKASGFVEANKYVISLKYNNLDKVISKSQILSIPMFHASHATILSQVEFLATKIVNSAKSKFSNKYKSISDL